MVHQAAETGKSMFAGMAYFRLERRQGFLLAGIGEVQGDPHRHNRVRRKAACMSVVRDAALGAPSVWGRRQ